MDLLEVDGWCWDCPFCDILLEDGSYLVLTMTVDHHLAVHGRQLVAVAEAVARAA